MFGCYQQIVYLCTVLIINTAPKILKKRELGKYILLKRRNGEVPGDSHPKRRRWYPDGGRGDKGYYSTNGDIFELRGRRLLLC